MGRPPRITAGGLVYHVLNRANRRATIFHTPTDYLAFERVMAEAVERTGIRLVAYAIMPNHWHTVVWPEEDGQLSRFGGWLCLTHTQRWNRFRCSTGTGHLYQGRFLSFPIQTDEHFLTVCRYVERNPLSARLVRHAEDWRFGSLWWRSRPRKAPGWLATDWPVDRPRDWTTLVNAPLTQKEHDSIRGCISGGTPYGRKEWTAYLEERLGLKLTKRPPGRPKKGV